MLHHQKDTQNSTAFFNDFNDMTDIQV